MKMLTDEEFLQFRDFILEKSGIFFEEKKRYFVEKRLIECFKESASISLRDYYRALKSEKNNEDLSLLLESFTTNETYFYRQISQIEAFTEEALPLVLAEKRAQNNYELGIWSAACSSGPEIYTIAILLKETISDFEKWKIKLSATDLDRKIINQAKAAIYPKRTIKDVPPDILKKYFTLLQDGRYQLNSTISSMVTFEHLNLMDQIGLRKHGGKDFIFCRNVLIYFDDNARRQVIHGLYNNLNKDGFIFLGHSESVRRISTEFRMKKLKKAWVYQK